MPDTVRSFIPWAEPKYWGDEQRFAVEALHSGWISGGPFVERLEHSLAEWLRAPFVVSTSNGTTAIHAAFLALGLKPGDEVIVPGFAFMAAANIALHMGAIPVFADVDPVTWCIDPGAIAPLITSRTKGIVPVHSYGVMADMDAILAIAAAHGLWVIEDAAEALGSTWHGGQAGTIAEIGTFSLHATKTITAGEGGAVATRIKAHRDRMALYRSHGVAQRRYFHEVPGHNFRLTNVQAAIGYAQLQSIETIIAERRRVYRGYHNALRGIAGVTLQGVTEGCDPVIWALALELDPSAFGRSRDDIIALMARQGVETRPGFYAASEMPHIYSSGIADLPVSTRLGRQIISLPSSPTVQDAEIDHIVSILDAAR